MALSDPARAMVAEMTKRAPSAAVFTDFDGTLSPIVDDPDTARPLPGVVPALVALSRRYRCVAVVSGRPAAYLAEHLGEAASTGAVLLIGLYGLERVAADGSVRADPRAGEWRPVLAEVEAAARRSVPAGVEVEDKGLAVTLHWRRQPEGAAASLSFGRATAEDRGLEMQAGRMSLELRPPLGVDKATVVTELGAGLDAACFLGDDVGDLAAFAALDRLADAGRVTFKVGVRSSEAPGELARVTDLLVPGPEGALELLAALAG